MIRAYSLQELLENINALEKPGLEQVFDRSWMLLTSEEQVGLIRLTIFRAPFSRDAAIQVAGIDLPMFSGFLDKSLVRRVDPSSHESEDQERSIFDFHPMMEQYLGEKLTSKPEIFDEVTTSHATYFLSYLEKMHAHLYTQEEPQAVKELFLVYEDVTAAMLWGSLNFHLSSVRKGLRFFIHYFESLGAFKEGKEFFGSIVDALTEVKSRLEGENQELNRVHSRAYWFYGWHQMRLAEEDLALENYHLGLELARKSQAEEEEAGILNAIALIYRHRDIEKSNRYLQSALEIGYRIEHSWHIGSFNINLGINATMSENYEAAEGYLTESLRIYQDIGHYWGIIGAITNLGKLQMHRNNDSRARELLHEALGLVDHYKYVWLRIKILVALGDLAYKNESWQEAVVYYQQGFDSIEVFGDKSMREEAQEKFDHAMSMVESLEKMS